MFGNTVKWPTPADAQTFLQGGGTFIGQFKAMLGSPDTEHQGVGDEDHEGEDPDRLDLVWWEHGDRFNVPKGDSRLQPLASTTIIPIGDVEGALAFGYSDTTTIVSS